MEGGDPGVPAPPGHGISVQSGGPCTPRPSTPPSPCHHPAPAPTARSPGCSQTSAGILGERGRGGLREGWEGLESPGRTGLHRTHLCCPAEGAAGGCHLSACPFVTSQDACHLPALQPASGPQHASGRRLRASPPPNSSPPRLLQPLLLLYSRWEWCPGGCGAGWFKAPPSRPAPGWIYHLPLGREHPRQQFGGWLGRSDKELV